MVQHDTSDKMKNSQFLDLMRKIRDREVEVQNNDLQSTTNPVSDTRTGGDVDMGNETDFYHEIPQSALPLQYTPNPIADTSTESATGNLRAHDPNTFAFPDMNAVYEYTVQAESAQTPPAMEAYSSHDDEYPNQAPQSQIQALHPGGRFYPDQTSTQLAQAEMSGAVRANGTALMNVGTSHYQPAQTQGPA